MEKWRKIGTYFDMIVEERGKNRRLIDWTGKIITEFRLDWFIKILLNIFYNNIFLFYTKKLLFNWLIENIGVNGEINLE